MAQKPSITLIQGDITTLAVDALVNAANEHLQHGGGVAGAISRRGGPEIQQASNEWVAKHGRVVTGSAAITPAGQLKAKYVIHAVGPVMGSGNEDAKLRSATLASLRLAEEYKLSSIAFPAISTGIFGYPVERCAQVMLGAVTEYLSGPTGIRQVIFCLYDQLTFNIFTTTYNNIGSK
ncbi:MAG TPA: macro domain-containing protein [bacterium]|nr:macro domain-containing protein [bacterium]HPN45703.1 macro domain-containing protein [bacterium]